MISFPKHWISHFSKQFVQIHVKKKANCAEAIKTVSYKAYDKLIHIKSQLAFAQAVTNISITIKSDNQSLILLANHSVLYTETQHIVIQYY